jgi:hypothetical protein
MLGCPIKYKTNNTKKCNIIHALSINKLIALHLYLASFVLRAFIHSFVCVVVMHMISSNKNPSKIIRPYVGTAFLVLVSSQQPRRQKTLENTFPCIFSSSGTMRSNRGSSLSVIIASSVEGYHKRKKALLIFGWNLIRFYHYLMRVFLHSVLWFPSECP